MCIDDFGNRTFRNEVIETIALIRYEKKIASFRLENSRNVFEMRHEVGLMLDGMAADDCIKLCIDYG